MASDVHTSTHPDAVVLLNVVEEVLESPEPPRPAEQATMHADGHPCRAFLAFGIEHVEDLTADLDQALKS